MINITVAVGQSKERELIMKTLAGQEDFSIASICEDGCHALTSAIIEKPDILIMDFCMKDISSPDLVPMIKHKSPSTALIALYSPNEYEDANRALNAGISGCLSKLDGFQNLASSVRSVFYGGFCMSKQIWDNVLRCLTDMPLDTVNGNKFKFSKTELYIFNGIALGRKDYEIARDLHISTGSVRNCVSKFKHKTGMKNRTQMSLYALLDGMISASKIRKQLFGKK